MEQDYRYTLIISQYYHSYHYFIVKFSKETFIKQMQELTIELDQYKGEGIQDKHISNSDPFYCNCEGISNRYNVNANGDIYFINAVYVNYLQQFIQRNINETRYSRQGFKKKVVIYEISKNHNYDKVFGIVEKHFEIA